MASAFYGHFLARALPAFQRCFWCVFRNCFLASPLSPFPLPPLVHVATPEIVAAFFCLQVLGCGEQGAHQGGHATARFLEGFLEGSLPVGAS